jgi:hypothetical protein
MLAFAAVPYYFLCTLEGYHHDPSRLDKIRLQYAAQNSDENEVCLCGRNVRPDHAAVYCKVGQDGIQLTSRLVCFAKWTAALGKG